MKFVLAHPLSFKEASFNRRENLKRILNDVFNLEFMFNCFVFFHFMFALFAATYSAKTSILLKGFSLPPKLCLIICPELYVCENIIIMIMSLLLLDEH